MYNCKSWKNILKIFPCIQLSYAKLYTLWGAIQLSFLWFQRIWINYTLFYLRGNIMNVKVGPFIFVFNKLHSPKGPHLVKRIRFIVTLSFQYWNRPNMLWFSHFASNIGWIRIAKNQIGLNPLFSLLENIIVVNYSFWRWWILKKNQLKRL